MLLSDNLSVPFSIFVNLFSPILNKTVDLGARFHSLKYVSFKTATRPKLQLGEGEKYQTELFRLQTITRQNRISCLNACAHRTYPKHCPNVTYYFGRLHLTNLKNRESRSLET